MKSITRSVVILSLLISFNYQTKAQVEVKINNIGAFLGLFTGVFEVPVTKNLGLETELIFIANENEIGGGVILHGKYYFEPDFSIDRVYFGFFSGGFGTEEVIAGFGFEAGYKWLGKRNVLFELGIGGGRVSTGNSFIPYGRMMLGYRFFRENK